MGYVYRHIRLDTNEVFYIGISKQNNNYMRARQVHKRNAFWKNIASKAGFRYDIIWECDSEIELIEKEKEFISIYGRKDLDTGTLCNLTDGGDGVHNYVHSNASKAKMTKSRANRDFSKIYTQEVRLKMRLALTGKKRTIEQCLNISRAQKGKRVGGDNIKAKLVLDLDTGIFYDCGLHASIAHDIVYSTFKSWLKGRVKSRKRFIYA